MITNSLIFRQHKREALTLVLFMQYDFVAPPKEHSTVPERNSLLCTKMINGKQEKKEKKRKEFHVLAKDCKTA